MPNQNRKKTRKNRADNAKTGVVLEYELTAKDRLKIIETRIKCIEARRGKSITTEQRDRVRKVAKTELGKMLLSGLSEILARDQDKRINRIIRVAAHGEMLPAPAKLTADFFALTPDGELLELVYKYVNTCFRNNGVYKVGGDLREAVLMLPKGLQVVFTLTCLDGYALNGGLGHFLESTNFAHEAVADCRLVGAHEYARILERAVRIWESAQEIWRAANGDKQAERHAVRKLEGMKAEADSLTNAYFSLKGLLDMAADFVRLHANECIPNGGRALGKLRRKSPRRMS